MNGLKRHRRLSQRLDQNTAERMFAGLAAADAPPDYALVAAVLAAAAAPVTGLPAPGEAAALRAYRDAKYVGAPVRAGRWFQPWRTMAGRFAVVATAGTLAISGGVAAAATGTVPTRPHHATHQAPSDLALPTVISPAALVGDFYSRATVATSSAPAVKSATRPVIRVIPADAATSTTHAGTSTTTTAVTTTSSPATTSKNAPQNAVTSVEQSAHSKSDNGQQKGNNGSAKGQKNGNGNGSAKGNNGDRGNGHANGQQSGNNGHGNAKGQQNGNNGNGHAKGQQKGNGNAANNPGKGHQKSGNGQG